MYKYKAHPELFMAYRCASNKLYEGFAYFIRLPTTSQSTMLHKAFT